MTALSAIPAPALKPVGWRRLTWVAWRHYRGTLVGAVTLLVAVAGYLLIDGIRMRSAFAAYDSCAPVDSAGCEYLWQAFRDTYGQPGFIGVVLLILPGVVGVFAGAPVLARELETGTFRFAWTQGVGRTRWGIAMLVPGAAGVGMMMVAFGELVTWYNDVLARTGITPRLRATVFPVTGPAAAGWAMAGFALGVLAGLLCRRVLATLAIAFAAWFGLAFLTGAVLRTHYLEPVTTTSLSTANTDLPVGQWWTRDGAVVSNAEINSTLHDIGVQVDSGSPVQASGGGAVDPTQFLLQHGYQQVTSVQPDSRYWPFQWIELGWLAALALLLLGVALWLLRRRSA